MDVIFQASDLAGVKRREFLEAAREGRAHLRDTDGTDIVALRAVELDSLDDLAYWSNQHRRLAVLLSNTTRPTIGDLGELAWLRVFDRGDLEAFLSELQDCLISAFADNSSLVLREAVDAWKLTARQIEDPLRRAVLTSRHSADEYVDGGTE